MSKVSLDHQNVLAAEAKIPNDVPVTMMNLVAFNAEAEYEDSKETPCSGVEAYLQRYAPAFNEVAAELGVTGIEVIYVGTVAHTILGPDEPKWDAIALVRYPNFAAMRKVTESPLYLEKAEPHRKAALRAWEFIATFQQPA
jgi:hypothetical protein